VLDSTDLTQSIIINERTTVATAYSMAQFAKGDKIGGTYPGLQNAAAIAQNLAELKTGGIAGMLSSSPNGESTSTLKIFNSLANMLAGCVENKNQCDTLFAATTISGGPPPIDTFQAMLNISQNPWHNTTELFDVSEKNIVYTPSLDRVDLPSGWVLALRYNGGGKNGQGLDGPGNIAFDKDGNAWINNNYEFSMSANPPEEICGSTKLIKLTPTGASAAGAPYGSSDGSGKDSGGLYGAGFGITLDATGNVWVSNFGFQGSNCSLDSAALEISVSKFDTAGKAISPDGNPSLNQAGGYEGIDQLIAKPQAIKSDKKGNIWIANCEGDSVTLFPNGNDQESRTLKDTGLVKPFGLAIDTQGHAWVTGNGNDSVIEIDENGVQVGGLITGFGLHKPMGIAADSLGNLWVSNAGLANPPCPALLTDVQESDGKRTNDGADNIRAAVTLIRHKDGNRSVKTFGKLEGKRDGLRWPWGISVDGNDNVWVANFAGQRIMQLCGVNEENCPIGTRTGEAISPDEGYTSDALTRVTAVQIDPSGNVWATNNWILDGFNALTNPGGHEVVVFIGLASPVNTPLLGPPSRP
jgi:streptogramin lyase